MAKLTLPEYGEHIIFAGTTGSGKTYLATGFLRFFNGHNDRWFVIDTQDSLEQELPKHTKITSPEGLPLKLRWFKKIRYVPEMDYRNRQTWNYVFRVLHDSSSKKKPRPRIVYIDEIFHIGYGPSFPDWLPRIITTARQRQVSIWTAAQRPSAIPLPVLTESRRIYIFYLSYEEDIKKIAKFTRQKATLLKALDQLEYDYSFIELDRITGQFREMNPVNIKRRK